MGTCQSKDNNKVYNTTETGSNGQLSRFSNIYDKQKEIDRRVKIPIELVVCHFTPSTFPMVPIVTRETTQICANSWSIILGECHLLNEKYSNIE
jgi:hypothetical protein